ncbi:MAG: hypothetical protein HZC42_15975 [Candidatus Eisenbacteria bacterium]|nr:hypothetical protein [Candidatus Eisenbacteria bacterium]
MPISTDLVGPRAEVLGRARAPVGISARTFLQSPPLTPREAELSRYSANPRNRYGDWYQDYVKEQVDRESGRKCWRACEKAEARASMAGYESPVYVSRKIPDLVVRDRAKERYLGLELKYLRGTGSLVKPKVLIDAIDFTHRPIDCIYVVDGEGWMADKNVQYLERWWQFTDARHLGSTLDEYF